jgi:hypothetical protein
MMIFDIPLNQICSHLVSHRPPKILLFAAFSSPLDTQQESHTPVYSSISELCELSNAPVEDSKLYGHDPELPRPVGSQTHARLQCQEMFPGLSSEYLLVEAISGISASTPVCWFSDYDAALISNFICLWQTHLSSLSTGRGFLCASFINYRVM